MNRSFGSRGGMGGGSMIRAVGRAVGAGVGAFKETHSATRSKPTNVLSISPSSSPYNLPVSATSTATGGRCSSWFSSNDEWEVIEGEDDTIGNGFSERFVLGPVPSKHEVEDAVSALQQILAPVAYPQVAEDEFSSTSSEEEADQITTPTGLMAKISSTEMNSDWIEPVLHLNAKTLEYQGCNNVFDAFRLLHANPSVQKMVVSLSSDEAVWDAVLKNEVVRELRESFGAAENKRSPSCDGDLDDPTSIMWWILDNTKAMLMKFIENVTKLVDELFRPSEKEKKTDGFEDILRSSLMLSVVVLLIVVVTRVRNE